MKVVGPLARRPVCSVLLGGAKAMIGFDRVSVGFEILREVLNELCKTN